MARRKNAETGKKLKRILHCYGAGQSERLYLNCLQQQLRKDGHNVNFDWGCSLGSPSLRTVERRIQEAAAILCRAQLFILDVEGADSSGPKNAVAQITPKYSNKNTLKHWSDADKPAIFCWENPFKMHKRSFRSYRHIIKATVKRRRH